MKSLTLFNACRDESPAGLSKTITPSIARPRDLNLRPMRLALQGRFDQAIHPPTIFTSFVKVEKQLWCGSEVAPSSEFGSQKAFRMS